MGQEAQALLLAQGWGAAPPVLMALRALRAPLQQEGGLSAQRLHPREPQATWAEWGERAPRAWEPLEFRQAGGGGQGVPGKGLSPSCLLFLLQPLWPPMS